MRQLFYLLMILNLLLFLWIYGTRQQPEQLQTGHPAIGDLRIVSDDVVRQLKSDVMNDVEAPQEGVLQVQQEPLLQAEQKPLSVQQDATPGVVETHAGATKPGATPAPFKHSPSRKIVTSINGYEVVLSSISSYQAAVRIFDQLLPSAGMEAYKSVGCGDEKCLFVDDAEKELFDAGHFIERDSAMIQKAGSDPARAQTKHWVFEKLRE